MNFLPFVTTLLIMMSLGVSVVISSSSIFLLSQKNFILQNSLYHELLSQKQKLLFDHYQKLHPNPLEKKGALTTPLSYKSPKNQAAFSETSIRDLGLGCEGSKLNLYPLIHGTCPELKSLTAAILTHLLENLYGSFPFYTLSSDPNRLKHLIEAMVSQKIHTFNQLKIPDPFLDRLYHKMLQGTNSSYPPLSRYCKIDPHVKELICFRFASKPVLEATLGPILARRIFCLESEISHVNQKRCVLKKEQFIQETLYALPSWIPSHLIGKIFNFTNKHKGLPEYLSLPGGKMKAVHTQPAKPKSFDHV